MSVEAITWALMKAPNVKASWVSTLVGLANHADHEHESYVGQPTLAFYTRKSLRQVGYDLRDMEAAGLITPGNQAKVLHVRADKRPTVWRLMVERTRDDQKPRHTKASPTVDTLTSNDTATCNPLQVVDSDLQSTSGRHLQCTSGRDLQPIAGEPKERTQEGTTTTPTPSAHVPEATTDMVVVVDESPKKNPGGAGKSGRRTTAPAPPPAVPQRPRRPRKPARPQTSAPPAPPESPRAPEGPYRAAARKWVDETLPEKTPNAVMLTTEEADTLVGDVEALLAHGWTAALINRHIGRLVDLLYRYSPVRRKLAALAERKPPAPPAPRRAVGHDESRPTAPATKAGRQAALADIRATLGSRKATAKGTT
jgi:hypothetical protein